MQMRYADTMRMFDVDLLPRWGKQHSAVQRTFSEQPNVIRQLLELQRNFAYDTFRCRRTLFIFLRSAMLQVCSHERTKSLGTGSICCLVECQTMYECTTSNVCIVFTCCVCVLLAFRCKSSLRGFTPSTFTLLTTQPLGYCAGKWSSYTKNEYNLFYHKLDAKHFHVKQLVFFEETAKNFFGALVTIF